MQTRSSSRLVSNPSSNPTPSTNPNSKGRNRRRSKQRIEEFNLDELSPPIVTMTNQRTMAQLLQAPTEGYKDAIVFSAITADNFELKHGLFTLVQNKQFFGHDKEDPHAHVRYFNKITSTLKFLNVLNTSIKLILFPFSLKAARIWLEKEPPRSIFTWDDLVLKFINQFFPPSKTTNLRNEITNFQQRFDESFSEAWDRFKDLLRACPHHGFLKLHQLDRFYNALNSKDQDSFNSTAGGNFLDKMPRECLAIIESKSKVRYSCNKPVVAKVSMNTFTSGISPDVAELKDMVKALLLDKKSQNQSPAPVKAVDKSYVTCGVYFDSVGITHQMSSVRTPQQNRVVKRRNQTLVEAARTMLIFSRAPLFLWAEAIATACFTQNRFIIHRRFNKTPYELINGIKPDILFLHVFGALCYPKKDREDIGKLGAKGDIGFFIGYSVDSCAYRIYNRRTKKIMETMNVSFDELSAMAFEQRSSKLGLQCMTSGQISSGLDVTYALSTVTKQQPTEGELDLLFEAMYDDYFGGQPSATVENVPPAQEPQVCQTMLTSLIQNAMVDGNTFVNPFAVSSTSAAQASSSSQNVDPSNMHTFYQPYPHEFQWTKDHPLEQVIGEPSRPVLTRNQLRSDGDMCIYALTDHPLEQVLGEPSRPVLTRNQLRSDGDMCLYALTVSIMELKNVKEAMTDRAWIESMQEELLQFKRMDVWVLVPIPDNISPLTLKWIFKNNHDEEQTVIRNKSRYNTPCFRVIDAVNKFTMYLLYFTPTDGNVYRDNIQEFVSHTSAVNYNQGNTSYRPSMMSNQIRPPGFPPVPNNQNVQLNQRNKQNRSKSRKQFQPRTCLSTPGFPTSSLPSSCLSSSGSSNTSASTSSSCTLPSNIITNPRSDLKAITTRSGVSYDGPQIPPPPSFLPKVVEDEPEATKDTVNPTNNGSTEDVQPQVVQSESTSDPVTSPIFKPVIAPVSAPKPNLKSSIPYPSRRNDERNREKANNQIEKFYQIFKDMSFEIRFADAMILMPKFASTLKSLIGNKEKLSEMVRTPLNEHCSAVLDVV
nr:integrase, catalytic region, zinc finger, CCHC-type, peptidase aspartic, catalytic [Tanacetum cinerariifolium]